jgi:hypothetical protein
MPRNPRYRYLNHFPLNGSLTFDFLVSSGQSLVIRCVLCDHQVVRSGLELATAYGAAATIRSIYPKLRCAKCRAANPAVDNVVEE